MQRAIILLGLGLAALAGCNDAGNGVGGVAEAQSSRGGDLDVRISGSSFIVSTNPDDNNAPTTNFEPGTSIQSGIAKGSGSAIFRAQTVFAPDPEDDSCSETPLPAAVDVTTTIVLTYNDGSILTLSAGEASGSSACSDGVTFIANLMGLVSNGSGRFEGASGAWEGTAEVSGAQISGDLVVDFE